MQVRHRAPEVHALVVPRRTLAHRKRSHGRLSAAQSDRLIRVVRMAGRAEEAHRRRRQGEELAAQAQSRASGPASSGSSRERRGSPSGRAGARAHRAWPGCVVLRRALNHLAALADRPAAADGPFAPATRRTAHRRSSGPSALQRCTVVGAVTVVDASGASARSRSQLLPHLRLEILLRRFFPIPLPDPTQSFRRAWMGSAHGRRISLILLR